MAESSAGFHEAPESLAAETRERHRAIVSLMEELEAVDWYDQRIDASDDPQLAAILKHNRDEEKEHASMTLEWLRRHDPVWDRHLRRYLFTDAPVAAIAEAAEVAEAAEAAEASGPPTAVDASLAIGTLEGKDML